MVTPDAGGAHNVRGGSSRILKKQRAGATRPNISGVCFVIGGTFVSAVSVKSADSGYPILELDRVGKARLTPRNKITVRVHWSTDYHVGAR